MPLFGPIGARIGYTVEGAGPPLVLIHGFTASRAAFANNVSLLTDRFTVISVELLGHGDSDAPDDPGAYGPVPAVQRLLGLLDELGYDEALVCGHSLGGALALRLALEHPDRVAGLVIINSNSAAGTPEWREQVRPRMLELGARVRRDGPEFLKHTRLYPARGRRLPHDVRQALVEGFDRLSGSGIAGTAEALTVDVNAWERLGQLSVPTLVVIGEQDRDFVENAPRFVERMPADLVTVATIEGGHAANLESPDEFVRHLVEFARRIHYLPANGGGKSRSGAILTALGSLMVAAGLGIVAMASIFGGDDSPAAAPPAFTGGVAGVSTPGVTATASPSPAPSASAVVGATQAPRVNGTTAEPTETSVTPTEPAGPTVAAPTATPPPPTPTEEPPPPTVTPTTPPPTATPQPTATPLPGPRVLFSGPGNGQPGEPLTFQDVSDPVGITTRWWTTAGHERQHVRAFQVSFAEPGCYVVFMTEYYTDISITVSRAVAIGDATCP
jgi:2-succinyl-6-hydroxy-2,4-cyclohexadiene-1-carboxylate synthase